LTRALPNTYEATGVKGIDFPVPVSRIGAGCVFGLVVDACILGCYDVRVGSTASLLTARTPIRAPGAHDLLCERDGSIKRVRSW